jgi:hypothetical protein
MYNQTSLLDSCHDKKLTVVRGDVRDKGLISKHLKGVDAIFPLACIVGAPACDKDPETAKAINLGAIKMLLELRSKQQVIIFPNTNSGYGIGQEGVHCTEKTPLNPVSLYGKLKVEAEKALLEAGNSITLRLATVFGISPRMRLDLLVNDYGYWISRIAHRIPNNNPSQAGAPIQKTAELFLSTDESRIQEILQEFDSDYIVADYSMLTSKFWAIINWAGRPSTDFFETYFYIQGNQATPVQVINTAYYSCLLVRLFNFDGKAVTNVTPAVITYVEKTDSTGHTYKQLTDVQQFDTYQQAIDFVNKQGPSTHKIVGTNPFISPIPLDAVPNYQEVYSSDSRVQYSTNATDTTPEVKIFEYTRK